MSNRAIALVFVILSWVMLGTSVLMIAPLYVFYSILCVGLAHFVYQGQKVKR